jgi:hypothetical protein
MRTTILFATLLLMACGGEQKPADAPSTTSTSTSSTADPTSTPAVGGSDQKCGDLPKATATALDACKADCEKLDDKAPPNTRCVPPRSQCKMNCDQQFKK